MHASFIASLPIKQIFRHANNPFVSSVRQHRIQLAVSGVSEERRAIVVGAGIAGLTAARRLAEAGCSVIILEASDDVGGRIRSDVVDGFILDRGFQVFIEAYPQCRETYVLFNFFIFVKLISLLG